MLTKQLRPSTKWLVSLALITSLATCTPAQALWGFSYLTDAYNTVASYGAQIKSQAKLVGTAAVVSGALGYAIGSNRASTAVVGAALGVLACRMLYNHWDQAERRQTELQTQKDQLAQCHTTQQAQIANLAAAQTQAQANTSRASIIQRDIETCNAKIAVLNQALSENSKQLATITSALTSTQAQINQSLVQLQATMTAQINTHTVSLKAQIDAQVAILNALQARAQELTTAQTMCADQIATANQQLEDTNAQLARLTSPSAAPVTKSPVGGILSVITADMRTTK